MLNPFHSLLRERDTKFMKTFTLAIVCTPSLISGWGVVNFLPSFQKGGAWQDLKGKRGVIFFRGLNLLPNNFQKKGGRRLEPPTNYFQKGGGEGGGGLKGPQLWEGVAGKEGGNFLQKKKNKNKNKSKIFNDKKSL